MNTLQALFFMSIFSISGCVWAAEQLTSDRQELELAKNIMVALYVDTSLKYDLLINSHSREEMEQAVEQCLADADVLIKKGIGLSDDVVKKLETFEHEWALACEIVKMEQVLASQPETAIELDDSDTDDDTENNALERTNSELQLTNS